jgi:hypothetical protein
LSFQQTSHSQLVTQNEPARWQLLLKLLLPHGILRRREDAVTKGIYRMKKIIAISAAFTVLASANVFAQDAVNDAKLNPWQDCGIGAMVFPDNGVAAAISNVIWDLGTTAVTSASASKDNCSASRVQTARFVTESYPNLEEEIVMGEGKHLTTMLDLMGCASTSQNAVSSAIRDDFSTVISTSEYTDMNTQQKAESLFNVVENAASGNCKAS